MSKDCPIATCRAEHHMLTAQIENLEYKVELLEKVALLADKAAWEVSCNEHADNCCKEWCDRCKAALELGDELVGALWKCEWLSPEEEE